MELFYFGSVCSNEVFNRTVAESRVKPSASAQNFEYALMKGFSADPTVQVTAVSAESIAAFPGGNRLFLCGRQDELTPQITTRILSAVNLPGIKNICHARGAVAQFKKWWRAHKDDADKAVLLYGLYPAVAAALLKVCRRCGCPIYIVITDVPSTMFTYTKSKNLLKRLFSGSYRQKAVELQGQFDGYVYLTEAMAEEVAPGKPYTVVETIADTTVFDGVGDLPKADPPALMYAGALYQKYGVDRIVDAFEQMQTDCELWLCGSGDYEEEIRRRAEINPRIRFLGRISREEVLRKEREATLLLNIRDAQDVYTRYSFPSKMIEYMLSGTPLFTSKLPGIPSEYEAYCFTTTDTNPSVLAVQIDAVLADGDLPARGERAQAFVLEHKNAQVQAKKIIDFLRQF